MRDHVNIGAVNTGPMGVVAFWDVSRRALAPSHPIPLKSQSKRRRASQISCGGCTCCCEVLIYFRALDLRLSWREVEDHARRHIAVLKAVEDLVDRRQGLQLDIGFDLAADSEGEGFGHILARADE